MFWVNEVIIKVEAFIVSVEACLEPNRTSTMGLFYENS